MTAGLLYAKTILLTAVKAVTRSVWTVACIGMPPGFWTPRLIIQIMTAAVILVKEAMDNHDTLFRVRGREQMNEMIRPTTIKTIVQVP